MLFNDIGLGYRLYQNNRLALVIAIVPTVEVHVSTPINQRGSLRQPIGVPDQIGLTTGVTLALLRYSSLAVGVSVPLTGPRPFDFEALTQLNFQF